MIEKIPFGKTGHLSTRTIFGAAALGAMRQSKADEILDLLLEFGVNHIDTAAGYGDSELRIAPWLKRHPGAFFVATKTGERTYQRAADGLRRSLERLGVDRIDLIQLHNLSIERDQQVALGPGGALEALIDARDEGLVRFIGVTGHGTYVAARHLDSLARFPFASVLAPYNHAMMAQREYANDFNALDTLCRERGVAMQTIKSLAARRWAETDDEPRYAWYKPVRDADALRRAVHFVLCRQGLFLNTSSDATLLRRTLAAASERIEMPAGAALQDDAARLGVRPLFVRDVSDQV